MLAEGKFTENFKFEVNPGEFCIKQREKELNAARLQDTSTGHLPNKEKGERVCSRN